MCHSTPKSWILAVAVPCILVLGVVVFWSFGSGRPPAQLTAGDLSPGTAFVSEPPVDAALPVARDTPSVEDSLQASIENSHAAEFPNLMRRIGGMTDPAERLASAAALVRR